MEIKRVSALQINPCLGAILSHGKDGWFMERYVNIFINGLTIDYVDNVNYSGIIHTKRQYSFDETISSGIIEILERELSNNRFLYVWVDEIAIPLSYRYKKAHFVHPLMIYGYNEGKRTFQSVFFDILRGQILVDINYDDIVLATNKIDEFYHNGGTENALRQTILSCKVGDNIKSVFHIDVFARQLQNYICCQSEHSDEWYTMCRPELVDSCGTYFGVQVYLMLIKIVNNPETRGKLAYKALHDFVKHKLYLVDRFKYISDNYQVPIEYNHLINLFSNSSKSLEKMRLLNIKYQVKAGDFPASFCCCSEYAEKLIQTLKSCYNVEMVVLPQIYDILMSITYSKDDLNKEVNMCMNQKLCSKFFIEYGVKNDGEYVSQIDVIRKGRCYSGNGFEYLLINNTDKYYLEKDAADHLPIRTITISAQKVKNIKIYTDTIDCNYTINIHPIALSSSKAEISIPLDMKWKEYHHLIRNNTEHEGTMVLSIIGEDPFLIRESIGIDADKYHYLHIKMISNAQTDYAQLFFSTIDSQNISAGKSVFFAINPDGESHSYYINMSENSMWHGVVMSIRFDLAHYTNQHPWEADGCFSCEIEKLEFVDMVPDGIDCSNTILYHH